MKYFIIPLILFSFLGLVFATEPQVLIIEHYMPEVELLPDTKIKYGEIFTIHAWLTTYQDKPVTLGYFVDVIDEEGNQVDSTLWFAKQDFVYEFDTTHPVYNITHGGAYFISLERADEMQRTGVMEKSLEFEIIKQTCRSDLFLAFRSDDSRTVCVKPYTLDKLIERRWAKPHTAMVSLDVKPIKDSQIEYCPKDAQLIQGGYYVTDDSTLSVSQKRFDRNGWLVEFTNPEEYKQYAYVFVDCVADSLQSEPERTSRYEKYLDANNELNFGLQYDKNGMIIDDLQRILDWCDYPDEKPVGWYFDWNNSTHHIDSKNCEWVENENE